MASNKELLFLSVLTFITVLAWIVFDVYHAATTETLTPVEKKLIEPLTPTFDHGIILKIMEKKEI